MSFTRIRTIKGRHYLYEEERWRDGRKVRSQSRCLGPVEQMIRLAAANVRTDEERGMANALRFAEEVDAYQRALFGETGQEREDRLRAEAIESLHSAFGLRLGTTPPTPIETAAVDLSGAASGSAAPAGGDSEGPAVEAAGPEGSE